MTGDTSDSPQEISYQISATVSEDESKINTELLSAGRFIRRMPKTLEGVSDSGGHTCATAAG